MENQETDRDNTKKKNKKNSKVQVFTPHYVSRSTTYSESFSRTFDESNMFEFNQVIEIGFPGEKTMFANLGIEKNFLCYRNIVKLYFITKENDEEEDAFNFTNFTLKYGYSSSSIKEYDVIILIAGDYQLRLFFRKDDHKVHFSSVDSLLTGFCIKSNFMKQFTVSDALGKGGFATVTLLLNIGIQGQANINRRGICG